ncbi:MAG: hypothetical protein ACRCUB_08070 [Plesiomonas shigelloides]
MQTLSNKIKVTNLRLTLRNNIKNLTNRKDINIIELSGNELTENEISIWHEYNINCSRLFFTGVITKNKESLKNNTLKLKKIIKEKLTQKIDTPKNITNKHQVVIFISQLLGLNHSPTSVTLMLALDFIKEDITRIIINTNFLETDNQLDIFVANHLVHEKNNYILKMLDSGEVVSSYYKNGCAISVNGVDIDYFNIEGNILEKAEIFDSINRFINFHKIPSISIGDSFYPDITKQKFNGYYLPLTIEHQGTESTKRFVFRTEDKKDHLHHLIKFPYKEKETKLTCKREASKKINVCIIGNRLDIEIDSDFAEALKFIEEKIKDIMFYIVGCQSHDKIKSDKVKFISYASNLVDFYKEENISLFLNPKRQGGGYSAFYAMQAGIPVVTQSYGDVHYVSNGMFNYSNKDELLKVIEEIKNSDKKKLLKKIRSRVDELTNHKELIDKVMRAHLI